MYVSLDVAPHLEFPITASFPRATLSADGDGR